MHNSSLNAWYLVINLDFVANYYNVLFNIASIKIGYANRRHDRKKRCEGGREEIRENDYGNRQAGRPARFRNRRVEAKAFCAPWYRWYTYMQHTRVCRDTLLCRHGLYAHSAVLSYRICVLGFSSKGESQSESVRAKRARAARYARAPRWPAGKRMPVCMKESAVRIDSGICTIFLCLVFLRTKITFIKHTQRDDAQLSANCQHNTNKTKYSTTIFWVGTQ